MDPLSQTEENYLKAIFKICERSEGKATTNAIANELATSAASVTDMLKRLADKGLIHYEKWRGVALTEAGNRLATSLIRKHRLWEVFLVEKLHFSWSEVHEIAEQLEHIRSPELVERLDRFLGHPRFDPHGDPIPDADGVFASRKQVLLAELKAGERGVVVGVQDHSVSFLEFLERMKLTLGSTVEVLEIFEYDSSVRALVGEAEERVLSEKVTQNLFVQKTPPR